MSISSFCLKSDDAFLVRSVSIPSIFDLKIDWIDLMASCCSGHVSLQLCHVRWIVKSPPSPVTSSEINRHFRTFAFAPALPAAFCPVTMKLSAVFATFESCRAKRVNSVNACPIFSKFHTSHDGTSVWKRWKQPYALQRKKHDKLLSTQCTLK